MTASIKPLGGPPPSLGKRVAVIPRLLAPVVRVLLTLAVLAKPPSRSGPTASPVKVNVSAFRSRETVLREVVSALLAAEPDTYFSQGGVLVMREGGTLKPVPRALLAARIGVHAQCGTIKESGWTPIRHLPREYVADLHADPRAHFPRITGVSSLPVFVWGRSVSVALAPGYYPGLGVYLDLPEPLEVAEPEIFYDALDIILRGSAFADRASLIAALFLIVQILLRPSLRSPAPAYVVDAPSMNSGKSTIGESGGMLANGEKPVPVNLPRNKMEWHYTLASALGSADPVLFLDNIPDDEDIDSPELEALLTSNWLSLRKAKMADTTAVTALGKTVVVTGNRLGIRGGLVRRVLSIRLRRRPRVFPFAVPNVLPWIGDNRLLVVSGFLGVIDDMVGRGFGRPTETLSSYRDWSLYVGSVVGFILTEMGLGSIADVDALLRAVGEKRPADERAWEELFAAWPLSGGRSGRTPLRSGAVVEIVTGRDIAQFLEDLGRLGSQHAMAIRDGAQAPRVREIRAGRFRALPETQGGWEQRHLRARPGQPIPPLNPRRTGGCHRGRSHHMVNLRGEKAASTTAYGGSMGF